MMSAIRVEDLVERCAAGNLPAFGLLYDACSGQVYGLTHRILRDHALAEAATRDIFRQIWVQAAGFDETKGSALAWIMTMTHHEAVDRVRMSRASRTLGEADATSGFLPDLEPVPEQHEANAEIRQLRIGLTSLTDLQREAILLAYFGGHTYREVSVLLALPLDAVKTRIRDGLIALRGRLPLPQSEPGSPPPPRRAGS